VSGAPRKQTPSQPPQGADHARTEAARLRAEGLTLAEIGKRLGVTRQRVHQLLQPVGPRHCGTCGREIERPFRYHPACRPSNYLPTGKSRGARRIDLTGQRFGLWQVLWYAGNYRWRCRCRCGTEQPVLGNALRSGTSRGCRSCTAALSAAQKAIGNKGGTASSG